MFAGECNSTPKEPVYFWSFSIPNESHILLLSTALRGQLTLILRVKKSNCYDSCEGYRFLDIVAYR